MNDWDEIITEGGFFLFAPISVVIIVLLIDYFNWPFTLNLVFS